MVATRLDWLIMAAWFAVSAALVFGLISAAIAAVLFGPNRGPGFIRRAAWLFASRPRNVVEWFGFGIAVAIALSTQLLPLSLASDAHGDFGDVGRVILLAEYPVAVVWLAYLVWLYMRRPNL